MLPGRMAGPLEAARRDPGSGGTVAIGPLALMTEESDELEDRCVRRCGAYCGRAGAPGTVPWREELLEESPRPELLLREESGGLKPDGSMLANLPSAETLVVSTVLGSSPISENNGP